MKRLWIALALAAALAGCATNFGLEPGASRETVLARMGRPTGVVALPGGGERLQYSLQPEGQRAWMAEMDAAGRLVRVYNALTADNFERIVPGQWTGADVEREFGPPAWVDRAANWNGPIWTYRWHDDITDKFYWIYLDGNAVVQRAHPGTEYRISLPQNDAQP